MRPAISALLAAISSSWPSFVLTERQARVWETALARYDDQEIGFALDQVVSYHRYGLPSVSTVVAAIEGEEQPVEEPQTDAFGRTILQFAGGPPKTKRAMRRKSLDGRAHPGRNGVRKALGLPPASNAEQLLGLPSDSQDPQARALIQGLADDKKPRR